MNPQVVVIGGGPAGLAVAISSARHGVATLLVEKQNFPIDKPCGEGLLPNAVAALGRLGVSLEDLRRRAEVINGIRYISAGGRIAEASFADGIGFGLRRTALSALLVEHARRQTLLEILTDTRADVKVTAAGGPLVVVGGHEIRPRLIVGADGLESRARLASGIQTVVDPVRRWGVRQHFDGTPWTNHVEVYFAPGLEAYVTPVERGVNVAWLWTRGVAELLPGAEVTAALLPRIPSLAGRLSGRVATDRALAAGPFRRSPRERARDGVLLVGDAAGYLDPITGEGVGLAMAQAELFAQYVVPLIRQPEREILTAGDLQPYLRAVDRAARPNAQLTRLMLRLARHPQVVERAIDLLGRSPRLFEYCLDVNMGRHNLQSVGRLLRHRGPATPTVGR